MRFRDDSSADPVLLLSLRGDIDENVCKPVREMDGLDMLYMGFTIARFGRSVSIGEG